MLFSFLLILQMDITDETHLFLRLKITSVFSGVSGQIVKPNGLHMAPGPRFGHAGCERVGGFGGDWGYLGCSSTRIYAVIKAITAVTPQPAGWRWCGFGFVCRGSHTAKTRTSGQVATPRSTARGEVHFFILQLISKIFLSYYVVFCVHIFVSL